MSAEIDPPEFLESFVERYIPLNRHGKVEDVAPMFLFRCHWRYICGRFRASPPETAGCHANPDGKNYLIINKPDIPKNTSLYPDIMVTTAEPLAPWQRAVPEYEKPSSNLKWRDF
jgi:hypothetical protein